MSLGRAPTAYSACMPWALLTLLAATVLRRRRGNAGSNDAQRGSRQQRHGADRQATGRTARSSPGVLAIISVVAAFASAYAALATLRTQNEALEVQNEQAKRQQAEQVVMVEMDLDVIPTFGIEEGQEPRVQNFSRLPIVHASLHLKYEVFLTADADDGGTPKASYSAGHTIGLLESCEQAMVRPILEKVAAELTRQMPDIGTVEISASMDYTQVIRYFDLAGQEWYRSNLGPPTQVFSDLPQSRDTDGDGAINLEPHIPVDHERIPGCVPG